MTYTQKETDEHSRTRIVSYLTDCYSANTDNIDSEKLAKLNHPDYSITLRDLAWMMAICESPYSFISINWDDKKLQCNVTTLHSRFKKMIENKIQAYSQHPEISCLSLDEQNVKIYSLVGIVKTDVIHDCNNEVVPEYCITTNMAVQLLNVLQQSMLEGSGTLSTNHSLDRVRWGRLEYNKAPKDFGRLTVRYSKEQTQLILEESEKGNFSVFAKVSYSDNTESFVSLTPPEVTNVRNNTPNKIGVIVAGFFTNIYELWVSKIDASNLLGLPDNIDIPANHQVVALQENGGHINTATIVIKPLQTSSEPTKESTCSSSINRHLPKPSDSGHDKTKNLKRALELLLIEHHDLDPAPSAIWDMLLTKESNPDYKISKIHGAGKKREITFKGGLTIRYHAAQAHIKNTIDWYIKQKNPIN